MLKAIHKMMNKPVTLSLIDHSFVSNHVNELGRGSKSEQPGTVLILRGLDANWLAVEWQHSGESVIVPVADIVCITSNTVK